MTLSLVFDVMLNELSETFHWYVIPVDLLSVLRYVSGSVIVVVEPTVTVASSTLAWAAISCDANIDRMQSKAFTDL
jgi:hypothetical protein